MTEETIRPVEPAQKLGPRYRRLWSGMVVSNLGDGIAAIAYPWLASAVTRNGLLIALIAVAQRLPWLVFTLPAGVITDRVDRRKLIVSMDVVRTALTLIVAATVLANEGALPSPESLALGDIEIATNLSVYLILLAASLLFGFAEVLHDNAAQTMLPAIVEPNQLEKANGNLWGAEMVANSFVGPPLGSLLLGLGFALPFFVDAGTFALAAILVSLISGQFLPKGESARTGDINWREEIKEGFVWLWQHPILRPLAITLGFLNGLAMMGFATFVLFAQEDLDLATGLFTGVLEPIANALDFENVGALIFAVLLMGAAVGGVLGSVFASRISSALGTGPSLAVTMIAGVLTAGAIGLATRWWIVFLMEAVAVLTGTVWNVITVSFRQTIIPDDLLGRVNSVYRFFGWGMMPIGSAAGGLVIVIAEQFTSRQTALRMPWLVVALGYVFLMAYAIPKLTTGKIEAAREAGIAAKRDREGNAN